MSDLPQPPMKPDWNECCHRGCCPCIMDYYHDAMERWEGRIRDLGHDPQAVLAAIAAEQEAKRLARVSRL